MATCLKCGALLGPRSGGARCIDCGFQVMPVVATPPHVGAAPPAAAPAPAIAALLHSHSRGAVEQVPFQLRDFAAELEEWVKLNDRDARRDTLRFWSLKLPAVVSSASASLLAVAHLGGVAAVLAALASACVLVDAVNPRGQLRNAHLRAVHDLRGLQHQVMNDWRIGSLKRKHPDELAAEILQAAERARDKIAKDLRNAETSFARSGNVR